MLVTACASISGQQEKATADAASAAEQAREQEAFDLGVEAYIYGYPLVTLDTTRRVMTNTARPLANHAPMGQFYNAPAYPDAAFRDVTAPNADTLYSSAWLDLAKEGLQRVPKLAFEKIMGHFKTAGTQVNGWQFSTQTGLYGTDYLQRAFITAIGLGANRPQDAVYPTSEADADGKPYSGAEKYVMHLDKEAMPPADAFWSLTMYDASYFFVDNPLDRYTLSSRSALQPNADGSVDLYLQNASPGADKQANWLPAPTGKFVLMLRLYWPAEPPKPSILDGSWKPPAVQRVP